MLPALSLLLPPRSLLIFSEDAYQKHLHGLADRSCDTLEGIANSSLLDTSSATRPWQRQLQADGSLRREERYSLTIRHVPHTTGEHMRFACAKSGGYGEKAVKAAAPEDETTAG